MKLNISGYSTALFSSWYFIEELGLLLDAGDGITAALLQKARKIENVFISHADRDHLAGLLQFNQLNAREGYPRIFYPRDCCSFPALAAFSGKFDPHVSGTLWTPMESGEKVYVGDDLFVQSILNGHVQAAPGVQKSFGYRVCKVKNKLKPEFLDLPKDRIAELMKTEGRSNMTTEVVDTLLTYSGDTPVDDMSKWDNSSILIHEATFLDKEEKLKHNTRGNLHSNLEEVMERIRDMNIETLILGHFSSRYSSEQIDNKIRQMIRTFDIKIPVYRLLPGHVHRDILAGLPLN